MPADRDALLTHMANGRWCWCFPAWTSGRLVPMLQELLAEGMIERGPDIMGCGAYRIAGMQEEHGSRPAKARILRSSNGRTDMANFNQLLNEIKATEAELFAARAAAKSTQDETYDDYSWPAPAAQLQWLGEANARHDAARQAFDAAIAAYQEADLADRYPDL